MLKEKFVAMLTGDFAIRYLALLAGAFLFFIGYSMHRIETKPKIYKVGNIIAYLGLAIVNFGMAYEVVTSVRESAHAANIGMGASGMLAAISLGVLLHAEISGRENLVKPFTIALDVAVFIFVVSIAALKFL